MKEDIKYTPAQESVLEIDKEKNFLVSASAGAGKTTIMAERIKRLIEKNRVEIKKMLVVTFTKLSALEMKQRVFNKLIDSTDPFVVEQREQIDTCHMGTIHSFCADVVREYFYLVDVDPNFSVLEGSEKELLFDRAIEKVLDELYSSDDQQLVLMMEKFCPNRDDTKIIQNVKAIYEFMEGIDDVEKWYADVIKEYDDEGIRKYFNEKIIQKNTYLKDKIYDLSLRFGQYDAMGIVNKLEDLRVSLCANAKNDLQTNLGWLVNVELPKLTEDDKSQDKFNCTDEERIAILEDGARLINKVKAFLEYAKCLFGALSQSAIDLQKQEEAFCRFCLTVAQQVRRVYSNLKKEKNVVDFSDMEKMTLEILRDPKASKQIKNDIEYVFVDEFQDVNGIQQELLTTIANKNRLFVVGDVKQSIYGFRQADPDIFVNLQGEYSLDTDNNKVVLMNDNFRCDKQIGDFVNSVFAKAMTQKFGNVDYQKDGNLIASSDLKLEGEDVCVELFGIPTILQNKAIDPNQIYDPTKQVVQKTSDLSNAEGRFIANKIKQLVGLKKLKDGKEIELKEEEEESQRYVNYKDIVILCRGLKNNTIDVYKQLLLDGIPAVIKAEDQTNYKEIDDIIAFFKVLNNHYDDYALATLLTSPLCQITFDELVVVANSSKSDYLWQKLLEYQAKEDGDILANKIAKLFDKIHKYQVLSKVLKSGELMLKLIQETDYEKYVTALPNGFIRKERLFAFIQQVGASTVLEMMQTPFEMDSLPVGETAEDVVRIMTIHASKGLQYDVVFMAGLNTAFNTKIKGNVRINKRCGMGVWLSEKERNIDTLRGLLVQEFDVWKLKEEELRLLYVALTRAKRKLICTFSVDNKKDFLADPSEATCMRDWLQNIDQNTICYNYTNLSESDLIKLDIQKSANATNEQELSNQPNKLKEEYASAITWQYPLKEWLDLPLKVVSSKLDMQLNTKQDLTEETPQQVVEITKEDLTAQQEGEDKTLVGKAYHKLLERCDFDADDDGLKATMELIVNEGWFGQEIAQKVDLLKIKNLLNNKEFKKLCDGGKIYREMPFLSELPYNQLFGEGATREIMLQGVIDLLVVKQDHAIVVDFKVTTNSYKVKERYAKQLNSYKMAVNKCLKLPVKTYVVSILDNKIIEF